MPVHPPGLERRSQGQQKTGSAGRTFCCVPSPRRPRSPGRYRSRPPMTASAAAPNGQGEPGGCDIGCVRSDPSAARKRRSRATADNPDAGTGPAPVPDVRGNDRWSCRFAGTVWQSGDGRRGCNRTCPLTRWVVRGPAIDRGRSESVRSRVRSCVPEEGTRGRTDRRVQLWAMSLTNAPTRVSATDPSTTDPSTTDPSTTDPSAADDAR